MHAETLKCVVKCEISANETRCDPSTADGVCLRCERKNIPCVQGKRDLNTILEEQDEWRDAVESEFITLRRTIQTIQASVAQIEQLNKRHLPNRFSDLENVEEMEQSTMFSYVDSLNQDERCSATSQTPTRPLCVSNDTEHSRDTPEAAHVKDILTAGLITLEQAVRLFHFYFRVLDGHLCDLVAPIHCVADLGELVDPLPVSDQRAMLHAIETIRNSSNLLLVAILCVAALHVRTENPVFPALYREYIRLTAMQAFSRHQTLDDIRALVIGSFWLNDVSWTLVSTAVRMVTERHMHESYTRWVPSEPLMRRKQDSHRHPLRTAISHAPSICADTDARTAYEEARLYYLIYIADHQSSIPYRRPPMTRQHEVVRRAVEWLSNCELANNCADTRLVALVKLWEILHDAIDEIGQDPHAPLDELGLALHARFDHQISVWYECWSREFEIDDRYELDDLERQSLYAHLFLHSMAFRAPKNQLPILFLSQVTDVDLGGTCTSLNGAYFQAETRRSVSERAIDCAHKILQWIGAVSPIHLLISSTSYAHTMATFAIVFLVKSLRHFGKDTDEEYSPGHLRGADMQSILRSVDPALQTLVAAAQCVAPEHMLVNITAGARSSIMQIRAAYTSINAAETNAAFLPLTSERSTLWRSPSSDNWIPENHTSNEEATIRLQTNCSQTPTKTPPFRALDSLENFDLLSGHMHLSGLNLLQSEHFGTELDSLFEPVSI